MKKMLLLYCALLFSTSINAQDVCCELMQFNDYKKNVNRTYRMTSTTVSMGQKQIIERDKEGRIHQTMTMEMAGQKQKMESVIVGTLMYVKQNEGDWATQNLDSVQMAAIKSQWENNQLQYYKNCKKLDNQVSADTTYRVYTADFDAAKMKELVDKSSPQALQTAEMMSKMEMKMTFYVNNKSDIEKSTINTKFMGQSFDSEMVYEYDMPITVDAPILMLPIDKKK